MKLNEIQNSKLQEHFERVTGSMTSLPEGERVICGLLDAYHWFRLTEGERSKPCCEAMDLLLSAEMRPGLRSWYGRCGNKMNSAAVEFREKLSALANENFG